MKRLLLLTLSVFVAAAVSANASTCSPDLLSAYDTAGFSCMLGDLTFSNFAYSPVSFGGAVVPPASSIDVTPVISGTETGLDFVATSPWQVAPGQLDQSSLTFDVSTTSPGITDIYLAMAGGFTGNGSASVTEDTPAGGVFTDLASGTTMPSDSTTFLPVGSLSVKNGINLVGGSGGSSAEIGSVLNLFSEAPMSTVPEPSLTLLCLSALGILPLARRRFVH